MLKYNIKNLFKLRGIKRPYAHLLKNGFSHSLAYRISGERMTTLSLWQIEKLCVILKCTPNDLLYWVADKEEELTDIHPLWKLRELKIDNLADIGKDVPMEKLRDFLSKVKEIENELKR